MNELKTVLENINYQFLSEAKGALTIISDMAVMEKYIAESYDQRILIELLQNADDSKSTNVKCFVFDNYFIFANNGSAFTESDIISISRSGASKKTKESIGFRGIGFKSVVSITNEILIFSNGTYFSFSKEMTAEKLNLPADKIPTIRIPFYVCKNEIDNKLLKEIDNLVGEGYNTVFVFKKCKLSVVHRELSEISKNHFLFLKNIINFESETKIEKRKILISRRSNIVELSEKTTLERWKIVSEDTRKISIAFMMMDNKIVSCNSDVSKLSCFLPTLDDSPIACIINANFVSDPSRKHLQKNIENDEIMRLTGKMFAEEIIKSCNNIELHEGIFALINERKSYNEYSDIFFDELNKNIKTYVRSKNLSFFSSDFEQNETLYFKEYFEFNLNTSNENYFAASKFLSKYAAKEITNVEILKLLLKKDFISKILETLYYKICVLGIKQLRTISLLNKVDFTVQEILSFDKKLKISEDLYYLKHSFIPNISHQLTSEELEWFCKQIDFKLEKSDSKKTFEKVEAVNKKNAMSKWRTAEQQCVDIELSFGCKATYVGNKNLGYDVESIDQNGTRRLIEVKLLNSLNGNFSLTNNEYTCAHQNGQNYYVCLIYIEENKMHAVYIQNPIKNLKVEKRIKQYEWFCEDYSGEKYTFSLN